MVPQLQVLVSFLQEDKSAVSTAREKIIFFIFLGFILSINKM
jgi:hypothetical protein